MRCPIDYETLVMTDRNRVEIDDCPRCRGVWLDRDEQDKLFELSAPAGNASIHSYRDHDRQDDEKYPRKKKKESILSELFDY